MEERTAQKVNAAISVALAVAALALFGIALKNRAAAKPSLPAPPPAAAAETKAQAYQDLAGMKSVEFAKEFASWTPGARLAPEKTRTGTAVVTGKIAKAYLTVRASVAGKPLTRYESVYVKFNDAGGHLFRPKSLETPPSGVTSLLFPLNAVSVLPSVPYDEARAPQDADLSAVLRDGSAIRLTAFISSLQPALLEELSVAYVCAQGSDCAISFR